MKETRIRLGVDDVAKFVRAAEECDFDIDVNYNRVLVDAKSILGVLSMDLGRALCIGIPFKIYLIRLISVYMNWAEVARRLRHDS